MLAYAAIAVLIRIFALLPLGAALALGRLLGSIAFSVVRVRRRVVLANLEHVFGREKTEAERRAIARECYRQFAMTAVEILRSSTGSSDLVANVEIDHLERFPALRDAKTPLIFLQAHAGNFDLAAYSFGARGFPHHVVMRQIKNRRLHELIVRTRGRYGLRVHVKGKGAYDAVLAALRAGEWIGLVPDQNAREHGVTVDWLGRPASIFSGPAALHLATGARIIVAVVERRADDPRKHHAHMTFLEPYPPTGDDAADHRAIMQAVADAAAARIRLNPAQYFWFHRLWGKL